MYVKCRSQFFKIESPFLLRISIYLIGNSEIWKTGVENLILHFEITGFLRFWYWSLTRLQDLCSVIDNQRLVWTMWAYGEISMGKYFMYSYQVFRLCVFVAIVCVCL